MPRAFVEPSSAQLQCLIAVVDAGSFAAAGRRLGMTPSGVSKTIARLEDAQGVRLLHRSTHNLALTDAGEQVIDAVRAVATSLDHLRSSLILASEDDARGRVRLTAPVAFARSQLLPLLAEFRTEHPQVVVDVRASDEMIDLADAGIDVALRAGEISGVPGHLRQKWFDFDWVACASSAYLDAHGIPGTPSDLERHAIIGFRNRGTGLVEPWWFAAERGSNKADRYAFDCSIIFDDAESVWHAVTLGMGVGWCPSWLASADLGRAGVLEVLPEWRVMRSPMTILRRDAPQVPGRVKELVAFLKSKAATLDSPLLR
ncbi:transcriptional regulator, LysR family [Sphingomonas guangdongensis]|uniref:Transcriptional regulator, LysR family n=1 Tax=Sphingomonas guangdongensis TaxID=1141890 RepID=A0A285QYR6_9SPHN|nr:LysR family transcriptional regulator [Sphingomonas guangdongensis]SOB87110.1 transcriptional regulator, LysR family [Sphingomonas guangdongensis]